MWSEWQEIVLSPECTGAAIYRVRLLNNETDKPLLINRFLGVDGLGIVSLGKATNIKRRIQQFCHGVEKCQGHSEGNLFNLINQYCTHIKQLNCSIEYQYKIVEVDLLSYEEEHLIKDYIKYFGEVPPLNSAIPRRYDSWVK